MDKIMKVRRFMSFFLTFAALGTVFFIVYYTLFPVVSVNLASGGSLDLSGYNFVKRKIVCLNGEWNFYPGKFLSPGELSGEPAYTVEVPGKWAQKDGYDQEPRGVGTYHLFVSLPKASRELTLRVENIWMSHRLYINGRLVSEMGEVSGGPEGYAPKNVPYLVRLEPDKDLDIVIQASNFTYSYGGGIIRPIQLGDADTLEMRSNLFFGLDLVWIYLFLMFGIYHMNMYQMREKETISLYSGAALVLLSAVMGFSGEKIFVKIFSGLPPELPYKIQDVCITLAFVLLLLFINDFAQGIMKKKNLKAVVAPILLYLGTVVLSPCRVYTAVKPFFYAYGIALASVFFVRVFSMMLRNRDKRDFFNEISCVAGMIVCVIIVFFSSALFYTGFGATGIGTQASILGAIIFLNLFLARRFTNKMNEVQDLTEKLRKSDQIKNEFMERISYQFIEPLAEMSGISESLLMESDAMTPKQRGNIHMLKVMSGKLSLLLLDLIDAIRLRYEDIDFKIKAVDVQVVTDVVFRILARDAEEREIRLINRVAPMTFAEADENRLRQIIYNLAENALAVTLRGEITAEAFALGSDVILVISDMGPGVPEEQWESVFVAGSGEGLAQSAIGLYLSRQLARKMKGDIWISKSELGVGTEVTLKLPRGELSKAHTIKELKASGAGHGPLSGAPAAEGGAKKLLIVDDELKNIDMFNLALGKEYQIYTAYNGPDALKVLQNHPVDLVIADMVMPGMSGMELTKRIRRAYSVIDLPVIITADKSESREVELAYRAEVNDYIPKPFTVQEIRFRVRAMLQLSDAMEAAVRNEVAFMQAQIKPHFIYNAISNIIALCYEDGTKAAEVLSKLARYLRYILLAGEAGRTAALRQELDIIEVYVEIEKLRFGGRLSYETDISPEIDEDELVIPTLLIQPLVENAIRHGLFNKVGPGVVRLTVSEKDYFILIVVEDNGTGMGKEKLEMLMSGQYCQGVGIRSVRKRAEALREGSFWLESAPGQGTRASLLLPKKLLKPGKGA